MRRSILLALASVLAASVCYPALADWDKIGTYDIGYGPDRESHSPDFGGPVERLRFTARDGDVQCAYIRATFGNGQTRDLFTGRLRQGEDNNVDLPGDRRDVSRISFNCHAFSRSGARIEMSADIGSYRSRWMQNPNWKATWSRFLRWSEATYNNMAGANWAFLGSERFQGRRDEENRFTGWGGRNLTTIGLKPVGGDAKCGRVLATFGNGQTRELNANGGDTMREGQMTRVDLPGDVRNVTRLDLRCHAVGRQAVTIDIYGR